VSNAGDTSITEATPTPPSSTGRAENVVRSAGIVSIAVLMSRITGLMREMVMAGKFGAGLANDAFQVGFRIPNLTRDLFAEGALSSAFVPIFTEYLQNRSKEEAARLASLVGTAIIIVVGSLCLLGMIFAPALVGIIAPGYKAVPGKFELAVYMTRIMFPFLLVVALAAQAMGVLNACNQFAVPALASSFFNVGSVIAGLLLGFVLGPRIGIDPIVGMAWGVVAGGMLQLCWQIPSLRRSGFKQRLLIDWRDPGLVRIGSMMLPAILGNAAVQINVMVNSNFASRIFDPVRGYDGAVSWLQYAFRLMQLPLGLFGVAIASATLPSISRSAALKNIDEMRQTMARSLGMVFLLTVPSTVGLMVLGQSVIGAIYERGTFKHYDTQQTALALSFYALGLVGYSAIKVLNPAFYALNDARTPMLVSLFSILINFVTVSSMVQGARLGHAGLALATAAVSTIGFLLLFWQLRNKIGGIHGRALARSVLSVSAASAVMGAAVWTSSHFIRAWLGSRQLAYLADIAISIPLGVAVLYGACRVLRVPELEFAMRALAGPVARRLGKARA
jgi:putative peptidoglycan lipid II flippase